MILKPWNERRRTANEIQSDMQKRWNNIAGVRVLKREGGVAFECFPGKRNPAVVGANPVPSLIIPFCPYPSSDPATIVRI